MAEIIRAKVEGAAELRTSLAELGTEVATKVGVSAGRRTSNVLRDELRRAAPYDPRESKLNRSYGSLRENIKVSRKKARKQHHIVFWVTIGRAFWGFFQEVGTSRMDAKPWMGPAFAAMRDRLADIQITELRSGIERAARRVARLRGRR